jgi:aspartyl-tRNA(Asn)/glutamyl-tRNA(Gln) amidotransferase subunit A
VPGTSVPAPRIGELKVSIEGQEETVRSALIRLNRPANFTGHPAITLPCGFTPAGLPLGLQILGRRWDEAGLLRIAHAYEQATEWHERKPGLASETKA